MSTLLAELQSRVGKELGVSDWVEVTQEMIDAFAECTGDHQWIHVDRERAAAGPFGGTIAHGYLTLSLLPRMNGAILSGGLPITAALNYGSDKVRFLTPVRAGKRVRARVKMLTAEDKGMGRVLFSTENTVEIEGEDKPALVAVTLAMAFG